VVCTSAIKSNSEKSILNWNLNSAIRQAHHIHRVPCALSIVTANAIERDKLWLISSRLSVYGCQPMTLYHRSMESRWLSHLLITEIYSKFPIMKPLWVIWELSIRLLWDICPLSVESI